MARSKYRVKVVVHNHYGSNTPDTKYVIQKKYLWWWDDEHKPTTNKDWAYRTCEEMNTDYEDIRAKNKSKK